MIVGGSSAAQEYFFLKIVKIQDKIWTITPCYFGKSRTV